jgi:hypothetical protein
LTGLDIFTDGGTFDELGSGESSYAMRELVRGGAGWGKGRKPGLTVATWAASVCKIEDGEAILTEEGVEESEGDNIDSVIFAVRSEILLLFR